MNVNNMRNGYMIKSGQGRYCRGVLNTYAKGNHAFIYFPEEARIFDTKAQVFDFIYKVLNTKGARHYKNISIIKLAIVELVDEKVTDIIDNEKITELKKELAPNDQYYYNSLQTTYNAVFLPQKLPPGENDKAPAQTT